MSDWLDSIRNRLDAARHGATFFFRDDDAGWEHERLCALLDLFLRFEVPIDIAAIPTCLTTEIAADLRSAAEQMPDLVNIHQHGLSHVNHEVDGRKSEFGPSRTRAQVLHDLESGRRRLQDLIGPRLQPIFTPPWNRCTDTTVECARDLGFRIVSRDMSAGRASIP